MEANLAARHVCKLCNKSFPCGRSLGGHMKSHLSNNSADHNYHEKQNRTTKTKLQFANFSTDMEEEEEDDDDDEEEETDFLSGFGYGHRKNPKKSQKQKFLSDKFCRECGKGFQSWKALFGHMKCHSEKVEVVSSSLEMEEEPGNLHTTITVSKQKLVTMDIQSDNETETENPNKRKRSKGRKRRRGMMRRAVNSASFSFLTHNYSSSSSDQQEQEVAISLMMLSRDHLGDYGVNYLISPTESTSSDTNSKLLAAADETESKASVICNGSETVKLKKQKKLKVNPKLMGFEGKKKLSDEFNSSSGLMMIKKSQLLDDHHGIIGSKTDGDGFSTCKSQVYKKKTIADFMGSKVIKKPKKRSKLRFECDICNKIFHSYQALGGHRASHKKMKSSGFASTMVVTNVSEERNYEREFEPSQENPTAETESKLPLMMIFNNGDGDGDGGSEQELGFGYGEKGETSSKSKRNSKHKCPICERVFASGQALGGHKRSHLIKSSSELLDKKNQKIISIEIQKKLIPEMREFLDLNLPAHPLHTETKDHTSVSLNPWWLIANQRNHRHHHEEPLMDFTISN